MEVIEIVSLVLVSVFAFLLASLLGGFIAYNMFSVIIINKAKPLDNETLRKCEEIIKKGKQHPFLCKLAVKEGKCPNQPCDLIKE